jgi:ATP-dependent RNA circularization protein (DNA/RNA ligase family)
MIRKYPRTRHLEGSRLQPGDDDLDAASFDVLSRDWIVIEEKLDGANSALSFVDGELHLQSRGHYLMGGAREKHFDLFKQWATTHQARFRDRIGERYVVYGEWLYAKHEIFYDALPHYFMEFDVLDRDRDVFLSTKARRALLDGLAITPVPVLWEGKKPKRKQAAALVGRSNYSSELMEGLYVKVETEAETVGRYKFIRPSFLQSVLDAGEHWLARPIVPNKLRPGVDIFRVCE